MRRFLVVMVLVAMMLAAVGLLASTAAAQTQTQDGGTWYASLPPGTAIHMKLETRVSTTTSREGEEFWGRVTEPVQSAGRTIIPAGATVQGRVVRVSEPRRITGKATLDLRPETVTLPNGERYTLNAVIVDTSNHYHVDVDDEGRIKGKGMDGSDRRHVALGTGAGVTVGALTAGGAGALVGAGIGAGATLAHWLVARRSAHLPAGTEIILELTRSMVLSSEGAAGR